MTNSRTQSSTARASSRPSGSWLARLMACRRCQCSIFITHPHTLPVAEGDLFVQPVLVPDAGRLVLLGRVAVFAAAIVLLRVRRVAKLAGLFTPSNLDIPEDERK
jgi:hypothetical protein